MKRLPDPVRVFVGRPLTPPSVRKALHAAWLAVVRGVTVAANWLAGAAALVAGGVCALAFVGLLHQLA